MDVKQNVYLLTEDWLIPNNMRSGKCYSVVWVVRAGVLAGQHAVWEVLVVWVVRAGVLAGHPMFPRMGAEGGPSACHGQLVFPCVGAEGGASGGQGAGHLVCHQLCW